MVDSKLGLRVISERWRSLAKEQKISAGILGVCGIIALVLSVQRINATIRNPFTVSKAKFIEARRVAEGINPEERQLQESKRRDTDGDGISDYNEEKILSTSPYLRDTDGDGIPDHIELAQGTNPNCATGEACKGPDIDYSLIASSSQFLIPTQSPPGQELIATFQRGINEKIRQTKQAGDGSFQVEEIVVRDPAAIRKLLEDSGKVKPEMLNQISDQQLLELYDQVAVEAAKQKAQQVLENK